MTEPLDDISSVGRYLYSRGVVLTSAGAVVVTQVPTGVGELTRETLDRSLREEGLC